ncbi:MAG: class I SAM-dependent rRNA methyltransferase [Gemmatimonadetes bacterium]|nr:class I SAM-dependent rRNA methyltransferase [Gemmatimonadota bacterium]
MATSYPQIRLRRGAERLLIKGHPWVFSGAVTRRSDDCEPGCIVDVTNDAGRFIARGYFNPHSEIAVRIFTRRQEVEIDTAFLRQRIEASVRLRDDNPLLHGVTSARRLIHGESDGLPGLILDDYNGWLVMQIHTLGMEKLRAQILESLQSVITTAHGIYERSDVGTRRADGMTDRPTGPVAGDEPPELVEFHEGDVQMVADLRNGQKTGFFLDQRENRLLLGKIASGASVLNCFSYTGGFSTHARHGGATRTLDVDVVPAVLKRGRLSAQASGSPAICSYAAADGFHFLDMLAERGGQQFDIVVVDPPSLVRKGRDVKSALGVYTKLNRNALRLVRDGGYLLTASCSTRVSEDDFFQVVRRAAPGARVDVRLLQSNGQPSDHPVDPAFPEGRYLKSLLLRVFRG